jgi:hypothetical protein
VGQCEGEWGLDALLMVAIANDGSADEIALGCVPSPTSRMPETPSRR